MSGHEGLGAEDAIAYALLLFHAGSHLLKMAEPENYEAIAFEATYIGVYMKWNEAQANIMAYLDPENVQKIVATVELLCKTWNERQRYVKELRPVIRRRSLTRTQEACHRLKGMALFKGKGGE